MGQVRGRGSEVMRGASSPVPGGDGGCPRESSSASLGPGGSVGKDLGVTADNMLITSRAHVVQTAKGARREQIEGRRVCPCIRR